MRDRQQEAPVIKTAIVYDTAPAGRTDTAYGGVHTGASLFWLWGVEDVRPDRSTPQRFISAKMRRWDCKAT